jgi:hypothetical protein
MCITQKTEPMLENCPKVGFYMEAPYRSVLLNYFGLWGNIATLPQRQLERTITVSQRTQILVSTGSYAELLVSRIAWWGTHT